jgi:hypothetical protein
MGSVRRGVRCAPECESEAAMTKVFGFLCALALGVGLTSGVASAAYNSYRKLKDGSKVLIKEDRLFTGNFRTAAADGAYTLDDGTTINVQGGRMVSCIMPGQTAALPCNFRAPRAQASGTGDFSPDTGQKEQQLKDGTKVVLKEGQLYIGDSRTPAADGSYELRNGKTVRVQGGLVVGIVRTHKPF